MGQTLLLLAVLLVGTLYWFPIRRWYLRWGATDVDVAREMPGDGDVKTPTYTTTLAVSVATPPGQIWPWLVQMGDHRGGLYSYDWLDQLFGFLHAPSADRVLPEHQRLAVGDVIPIGRGPGFPVRLVDEGRSLVLGGVTDDVAWIWSLGLYPIDARHTRLVSRNRASVPGTLIWRLFMVALEPAAFIMTRKMLLGLKRRAEAMASRCP